MELNDLRQMILEASDHLDGDFHRIFHGRGGLWEDWKFLTIDSIDDILSVAIFSEIEPTLEDALIEMLKDVSEKSRYKSIVIQRRYVKDAPAEVLCGEIGKESVACENGMKFKLNLLNNQNSGYFGDMREGRAFVRANSHAKNVLNLFSYTCGFSLAAKLGGAANVVNVDMSKGALSIGKANHALSGIDPRGISFLPYNILKSFSGLRKKGPYDLIIIDPPSFQRGSFAATKDYVKIIQKLSSLACEDATVLACLNAPELDENFLLELFSEHAPEFRFIKRLDNVSEYASADESRSLKNFVFKREG